VIHIRSIVKTYIGNRAPIPVLAERLKRYVPKTNAEAASLAFLPKGWPFSGQSIPLRRIRSGYAGLRSGISFVDQTDADRLLEGTVRLYFDTPLADPIRPENWWNL
jgi:hypothetical protein